MHRERASRRVDRVAPVLLEAASRLLDRLDDVTRDFEAALDLGGRGVVAPLLAARGIRTVSLDLATGMARRAGGLAVVGDEERLPFRDGAFDLIVASLSLHWINDLPGALIQLRRALRPDGLLLASVPVLDTLLPLRQGLLDAETTIRGGASPRVSPLPALRDGASLLQRAGFALPVADLDEINLAYADPLALLRDLRDAGETNALRLRDRRFAPRALLPMALGGMAEAARADGSDPVSTPAGAIPLVLRLGMLTGWAPAPTQPKPLARGSAQTSLSDVFGTPDAET